MSTPDEKLEAVRLSVAQVERRVKELEAQPTLTRAEEFEIQMARDLIHRGQKLLKEGVMF